MKLENNTNNKEGIDCHDRLFSYYLHRSHGRKESALEFIISDMWQGFRCGSCFSSSCLERAISILVGDDLAACALRRHIIDARAEIKKLREMVITSNDCSHSKKTLTMSNTLPLGAERMSEAQRSSPSSPGGNLSTERLT
jgi:hypothetical protein